MISVSEPCDEQLADGRQRLRSATVGALVTAGWLATALAYAQPMPQGEPFQVNTTTSGDQTAPDITWAGDAFIVVWQDPGGIRGQRVDPSRGLLGAEFDVPPGDSFPQREPRVAGQSDGRFMVQWFSELDDNGETVDALRARSFDPQGVPLHPAFITRVANVSFYDSAFLSSHDLAATEVSGRFVTATAEIRDLDGYSYGSGSNVRFDLDGGNLASTSVESGFEGVRDSRVQRGPAGTGAFQVWTSTTYVYLEGIFGRRLDANGSPLGSRLNIRPDDGYGTGTASPGPDVAVAADGSMVVVWEEFADIRIRRFGPDHQPLGEASVLNDHVSSLQTKPRIGRAANGTHLVVWQSESAPASDSDQSASSIRARQLDQQGFPLGDEFQVNALTQGRQTRPVVSATDDGATFLVTWQSATSDDDTSGLSIRARRYFSLPPVFNDGFESGDTSAWTMTVP